MPHRPLPLCPLLPGSKLPEATLPQFPTPASLFPIPSPLPREPPWPPPPPCSSPSSDRPGSRSSSTTRFVVFSSSSPQKQSTQNSGNRLDCPFSPRGRRSTAAVRRTIAVAAVYLAPSCLLVRIPGELPLLAVPSLAPFPPLSRRSIAVLPSSSSRRPRLHGRRARPASQPAQAGQRAVVFC